MANESKWIIHYAIKTDYNFDKVVRATVVSNNSVQNSLVLHSTTKLCEKIEPGSHLKFL